MRPELDLLLCCSRTQISPEQRRRVQHLIAQNLDWNDIIATARWHGVSPLLYWQLKSLAGDYIPPLYLQKLDRHFKYNLQRNLFLTSQLIKIIKLLDDCQIPVIPFKGPVLAKTIYHNIALRKFYDLDLFIAPHNFPKVKQLLIAQGYQARYQLNSHQEKRRLIANYECEFIHEKLQTSIDLHWQFAPPCFNFTLQLDSALARAQPLDIGGTKLSILNPEDLLLVLCINGTKDGWSSLQRICDLAEFLATYSQLNWSLLWQDAATYNCTRMVLLGLHLAHQLLQASLPLSAEERLQQDPEIARISQQVCDRLFGSTQNYLNRVQLAHFSLQLQPNLWQKVNYCFKLFVPINERDLAFLALPKVLFPFYYLLRLIRLFLKYVLHRKVP
jgi:hypothetical protein